MPVTSLDGTELFYVEVGESPPCLMMHGGLGFDHTCLHPFRRAARMLRSYVEDPVPREHVVEILKGEVQGGRTLGAWRFFDALDGDAHAAQVGVASLLSHPEVLQE